MTVKEATKKVIGKSMVSKHILLSELLSDSFITKYTQSSSTDEFFEGLDCFDDKLTAEEKQHNFDNLDVAILDNLVRSRSQFQSWVDLLQFAVRLQSL